MGIRSFLAFELPTEIREQIGNVSRELRKSTLPIRWVRVENIHLTVVFLGSVNENFIEEIKGKIDPVVKRYSTFEVKLNGVGVFPHWRRPRVIWLSLNGEIERISQLRDELQKELRVVGYREEKRPFRPHLTIGRFKVPLEKDDYLKWLLDKYHDISSDLCRMSEFILFKSDLKPDGPVYTKMAVWSLAKN